MSSFQNKEVFLDKAQLVSGAVELLPKSSVQDVQTLLNNLQPLINRIDIYENMFSPGITGQVHFRDSQSLPSLISMSGLEQFRFGFSVRDSATEKTIKYGPFSFVPYKLSNRSIITKGLEEYVVGLCTTETLVSTSLKFSKSYTGADGQGEYPHKIIEDVVRKPYGLESKKPFVTLQETKSKIKLVVPYMRPLDVIRLLTLQGQTIDDDTNFVFFETLEGYHYTSFKKLIENASKETNIPKIQMELAGMSQGKNTSTEMRAEQMQLITSHDLLFSAARGYFASVTIAPDVLSGKCGLKISGAGIDSPYSKRLRINGPNAREFYPPDFSGSMPPTGRMFLVPTTAFSAANPLLNIFDRTIHDNFIAQTLDDRNRELLGLSLRTLRMVVPGSPDLHAGKFIDVEFPSPMIAYKGTAGFDELASCRYLIIAAQHTLVSRDGGSTFVYSTTIEAVTDSYPAKKTVTGSSGGGGGGGF